MTAAEPVVEGDENDQGPMTAAQVAEEEARRDEAEFGFAQLRLVVCFLRWSNLKEGKERFDSPLLLLPVRLIKKKGKRDPKQHRDDEHAADNDQCGSHGGPERAG